MANRRRVSTGLYTGMAYGLLIEGVAFLIAYALAKAAGWVD